jgi:arabinoxylan arabinofuranohydrolase
MIQNTINSICPSMRSFSGIGALVLAFFINAAADNPVISLPISNADPAPCVFNDTVYMYNTEEIDGSLLANHTHCFSTTDMYHWKNVGVVLDEANIAWSSKGGHLWAPHVVFFNGKYHLYAPETAPNGVFYNLHATCNSPHGTFVADPQQMVINGYRTGQAYLQDALDPFCIMDTGAGGTGNNYLAWCITNITPNRLYIGRLSPNGDSVIGGVPTQLRSTNFYPDGGHYVEGQWWVKQNNLWYQFYAVYYPGGAEQIGIATATNLLDTNYRYRGFLMGTNSNSAAGTIHPGVCYFKNKWYMFWHCGGAEYGGSLLPTALMRSSGAEQIVFNASTTPWAVVSPQTPTQSWVIPKTYRGVGIPRVNDTIQVDRRRITTDISGASVAIVNGGEPSGYMLNGIGNNSWVRYDSVDFTPTVPDSVVGQVQVRVSSTGASNSIQVRLGSNTGTLLGTIAVPNTGSLTTWQTTPWTNLTTTSTTGVNNIALVFLGTANTMNVNWIKFHQLRGTAVASAAPVESQTGLSYRRIGKDAFMVEYGNKNICSVVKLFNMRGQEIVGAVAGRQVDRGLQVTITKKALSPGSYILTVTNAVGKQKISFVY